VAVVLGQRHHQPQGKAEKGTKYKMMMEAVRTSETSVDNHSTRQYNPEDSSEQKYKIVC
jgi:hypothetical protein